MKRNKAGFLTVRVPAAELFKIGSRGICDHCDATVNEGTLIVVMSHWVCDKCLAEWEAHAKYYPEDEVFEDNRAAYYRSVLNLGGAA